MNTLLWKRRIGRIANHLPHAGDRRVVLLYHSVGDSPWAVREADFQAQMHWLEQAEMSSLDELLRDEVSTGLRVALTFDDGYASLADTAAGILTKAGMTATVYLNTGLIEQNARRCSDASCGHYPDESFLSWVDVRDLLAQGWTIGSHGVEHRDLTALPRDRVLAELTVSKATIESRVGTGRASIFRTPGAGTMRHFGRRCGDAGYRYAAAAVHGDVRRGFDPYGHSADQYPPRLLDC